MCACHILLVPPPPLPGCRCPSGQLLQDGRCVPVSSCRCGLPSPNASWELAPAEVVQLDCRNWYDCPPMTTQGDGELWVGGSGQFRVMGHCWGAKAVHPDSQGSEPFLHTPAPSTCVNGSLACPSHECPALGPWSAWSSCSAPCGGGTTERRRSCKEGPGGAPCQAQDTEQRQDCNLQPCPGECPGRGPSQGPPGTLPHSLLPPTPRVPTRSGAQCLRCLVPTPLCASAAWHPLHAGTLPAWL